MHEFGWRDNPSSDEENGRPEGGRQRQKLGLTSRVSNTDRGINTQMVEHLAALRSIASSYLRHERTDHTLTPTALVNEAYLRIHHNLIAGQSSRGEFLAAMANTIRRVLVDHARKHQADKRGGLAKRICLTTEILLSDRPNVDVIDLDDALKKISQSNEVRAKIVELRFFAGLTEQETAEALGLSHSSVQRLWRGTRAALAVLLRDYDESQD